MSEFDISKLPKERRDALLRAEEYAAKKSKHRKASYRTNEHKYTADSNTKTDRLLELVYRVVIKESLGFSPDEIAEQLEIEGWDVKAGKISSREIINSFKDRE